MSEAAKEAPQYPVNMNPVRALVHFTRRVTSFQQQVERLFWDAMAGLPDDKRRHIATLDPNAVKVDGLAGGPLRISLGKRVALPSPEVVGSLPAKDTAEVRVDILGREEDRQTADVVFSRSDGTAHEVVDSRIRVPVGDGIMVKDKEAAASP